MKENYLHMEKRIGFAEPDEYRQSTEVRRHGETVTVEYRGRRPCFMGGGVCGNHDPFYSVHPRLSVSRFGKKVP